MTAGIKFVSKTSKRIGRLCCPKCESLNLLQRANHWYCRKAGCHHTFETPAVVKATPLTRKRQSNRHAGPAIYRGLLWGEFYAQVY